MIVARAILRAARLCAAVHGLWAGEVPLDRACKASVAIVLAAGDVDEALVASIAYTESRFIATAHNTVTRCAGPMGVLRFRGSELAGYRAGVAKLHEARAWCIRRRTPGALCMLATYRSGPRGPRERLYRGPRAVLARQRAIRRALDQMMRAPRPERIGAGA